MAIIGITGKARSGKDTFADMLINELKWQGKEYIKMAYSDELKRKAAKEFDLSHEQLYGKLKEVPDHRYSKGNVSSNPYEAFWTPREILQHLGTEGYRKIEPKFWIRQLFKRIDGVFIKNVIITDCRFPDEIDAILYEGGNVIQIVRDDKDKITNEKHKSETALDDYPWWHCRIYNNGSIENLGKQAQDVAKLIIEDNLNQIKVPESKTGGKTKWRKV